MSGFEIEQIKPPAGDNSEIYKMVEPPPPEGGPHEPYNPNLDRGRAFLIWISQAALVLGIAGLCGRFGVSPWMWMPGIAVFIIICILVDLKIWKNAATKDPVPRGDILLVLMQTGIWLTSISLIAVAWATYLRVNVNESKLGLIFCLFLVGFAILVFVLSLYSYRHQSTPWFQFSVGVILIPFLVSWMVATLISSFISPRVMGGKEAARLETIAAETLRVRKTWAKNPGWIKSGGTPIMVAVALSGGGYRAAAIHAGFLQTLDEKCVPISYLSTVSGGSIIGAWYALGYPPAEFKKKLLDRKPGLADDIAAIHWAFADLFWPTWSSADTYSRHFKNVFFDTKTLGDSSLVPKLLVNATDIEQDADNAREVFFKDRDPKLNKTRLADVVAASGAFPGAFQPKTIEWKPAEGDGAIVPRRFIDGGVVENLGIKGLNRYFTLTKGRSALDDIDILLISDASKRGKIDRLSPKVQLLKLLSRSTGITYDRLHLEIYDQLSDKKVVSIRSTQKEGITSLSTAYFPSMTAGGKTVSGRGNVVAEEVSKIDTLQELEPETVEKAFWVGYTLGTQFWKQIDERRKTLSGNASDECPVVSPLRTASGMAS